ncbi:MAG: GIY-YIG nuclease family protein [Alphaproteobacteria bacterium]|nr:GIY-YIG nuclease family protein [Alphaproteobacteria bacterium]MDE1985596.1 GIY-YIG nuclease family protein [Alphaproteobacteria bacterium]MDE2162217.1 GIY-YIG nuclease family protein [Alphaproteobacteria bacterium]MDE2265783.1 GIY-YIG nuclease family protein [Alphaproteobacteria bacterium]MDE2499576.1 GIY-YIG nuclease family protein [Alphaproteobacteria bacterium]
MPIFESIPQLGEVYAGLTDDLWHRLKVHNAGGSPHTSKFKPWCLVTYAAFRDEETAVLVEHSRRRDCGRNLAACSSPHLYAHISRLRRTPNFQAA